MKLSALTLLTCLAAACSNASEDTVTSTADAGGAELDVTLNQLRVDIYPGQTTPQIDAQSWIAESDTDWSNLEVDVLPSVSVSGTVLGYLASPMNADVPGAALSPISAQISVVRVGTITGVSAQTDINGDFSLKVPPGRGYRLSIVPDGAQAVPFQVAESTSILEDVDLGTIDLGYGLPVYGQIYDATGASVSGASVHLVDEASGIAGAPVETDAQGHYLLRAEPGDYTLEVTGRAGQAFPRISQAATLLNEDGLELDVDLGDLTTASVSGQVFRSETSSTVRDVKVRLRSEQLAHSDGFLSIETETDGDGLFSRTLLPGNWVAELIPEFDSPLSAMEVTFSIGTEDTSVSLGSLRLSDRIAFSSSVFGPSGEPIGGAAVNARQVGFDNYIYSSTTDDDGAFDLDLPTQPVTMMVSPPTSSLAVSHVYIEPESDRGSVYLSKGEPVSGVVLSNGQPVDFALVEIRSSVGELLATTLTDRSGNFNVRIEAR